MTNLARWRDAGSLQKNWAERARFAARFISPGLTILDLGCGAMDVEQFVDAKAYLPVDLTMRDARTRVVDLNREPIPGDLLARADLVTMLGVLEYLDDVPGLFRQIAAAGKSLLFTYSATEHQVGVDRRANDWVNDFGTAGVLALLAEAGLEVAQSYVYDARQILLVAHPSNAATATAIERRSAGGRPSLLVAGHYGRGNCGDEALLQCIYEAFRETHDIVVSVDEHGAFPGFWDWYPYAACRVVHRTNDAVFFRDPDLRGIIVGGGGLQLGHAANQVVAARLAGRRAVLAGIDDWVAEDHAAIGPFTRLFDLVAFRTGRSFEAAGARVSGEAMHGGDWALLLPTDGADDVLEDRRRALITLREFDLAIVPRSYAQAIEALLDDVRAAGFAPVFLPFCPEDERFLGEIGLDRSAPIERRWWNPRRMKQVVGASGLMLTVGRLHPLVFAAGAGTPVASVAPPLRLTGLDGSPPKLTTMAAELGIASVSSRAGWQDFLRCPRGADRALVAAAISRTQAMVDRLRAVFA